MAWWDDVKEFVGGNMDWLGPVTDFIGGAGSNLIRGDTRGDYWNILEQQRQREFEDGRNTHNAYMDWLQQSRAASDASRAASASASAARAAAAAQTERNRQKAANKAFKIRDRVFNEQMGLYQPYLETGQRVLPQMEKLYSGGADSLSRLNEYLNSPSQLQKLDQSKPAAQVKLKLPSYFQGGK